MVTNESVPGCFGNDGPSNDYCIRSELRKNDGSIGVVWRNEITWQQACSCDCGQSQQLISSGRANEEGKREMWREKVKLRVSCNLPSINALLVQANGDVYELSDPRWTWFWGWILTFVQKWKKVSTAIHWSHSASRAFRQELLLPIPTVCETAIGNVEMHVDAMTPRVRTTVKAHALVVMVFSQCWVQIWLL